MIILGLGSNMGDRLTYLERAIDGLSEWVSDLRLSSIYESPALLKGGAPESWNMPFFNMAVAGETSLKPEALLKHIKKLERQIGREDRGIWAPREIDMDILAWDDMHLVSPKLTIPHLGLLERAFALVPLAELSPDWRYPVAGAHHNKSAAELVALQELNRVTDGLLKTEHSITMPA